MRSLSVLLCIYLHKCLTERHRVCQRELKSTEFVSTRSVVAETLTSGSFVIAIEKKKHDSLQMVKLQELRSALCMAT